MNKKVIIIVIILLLLLVGGAAFMMSTKNKPETAKTGNNTEGTSKDNGPKSLKSLLTAGVSQKCTYKDVMTNADVEGTTFISGGKVRGDFSSTSEGKTSTGHSIFDGKTSYVWMDGTSTGFKMEIDPSASQNSEANAKPGLDLDKSIDYKCGPWIPDQSLFTPPSNVTFTSFSAPSVNQGDAMEGNQNLCSSCDSLTGEQKTQCLTALKCN